MTDATVQMIVLGALGLILLAGFIYMFDDFFGTSKRTSSRKDRLAHKKRLPLEDAKKEEAEKVS